MPNSIERQLGNYLLTRLLGRGGFANVYYGEHIYLKTCAAIKVLNVQMSNEMQEKFLMEARIAARLEHPHIVSVLEFGIENGTPYLVMDYAPHGTLRQLYPKRTRLNLDQVASYVQQITSALQHIHEQYLIHCDIKPENMLLRSKNSVLLGDFGIARAMQNTQGTDSDQRIVGTITYMAPEQLRNKACPASDQYALGAVIYEWLCGEPPFSGSYAEVAVQHALISPIPLRERVPHISEDVEQVVMIALAKEPDSRFKSMKAFATAFTEVCRSRQHATMVSSHASSLTPSSNSTHLPEEASTSHETEIQQTEKHFSRRTITLGLLGGIGFVVGSAFAWKPLIQALYPSVQSTVLSPGTIVYTYHGHAGYVSGIAWSRDSQHIASAGNNIQVWYATTGKLEWIYRADQNSSSFIQTMAWSPNNRYIAANIDLLTDKGGISIWETSNRKKVFTYPSSEIYQESTLTWSPDSKFIASATGGTRIIQVWNVLTGTVLTTYKGHMADISSIDWSPDGKLIASSEGTSESDKGKVHIWEATTGRRRFIYTGHPDPIIAVAWSPDGTRLASAGSSDILAKKNPNNNTIQVWKPDDEKPLFLYHGHTGPIASLAWSPDSRFLVSSCGINSDLNGTASIQVWNASNGHNILTYQGYHPLYGMAGVVSWSPDGNYIASGNFDGAIQIWKAP